MRQIMRSSLDYAGFAQLCGRSPIMREIMRAHNRVIPRSLDSSTTWYSCWFNYQPHLLSVLALHWKTGSARHEQNPVRTKDPFDLMGHMFSFCWAFVPMGFHSSGTALCSVLPTDCNEIYYSYCKCL